MYFIFDVLQITKWLINIGCWYLPFWLLEAQEVLLFFVLLNLPVNCWQYTRYCFIDPLEYSFLWRRALILSQFSTKRSSDSIVQLWHYLRAPSTFDTIYLDNLDYFIPFIHSSSLYGIHLQISLWSFFHL